MMKKHNQRSSGKGNGLNSEEQKALSTSLKKLLESNVSKKLGYKYESPNGGFVVKTIISCGFGKQQLKSALLKYLKSNCGIIPPIINENHGGQEDVVINWSELSKKQVEIIENEYNKAFPSKVNNNTLVLTEEDRLRFTESLLKEIGSDNDLEEIVKSEDQITDTPKIVIDLNVIKRGRFLISTFLTTLFKFEGKTEKSYSFCENKNEYIQTIHFESENEATVGHCGLNWYCGKYSHECLGKEGNDIFIDFSFLDRIANLKRLPKISFTMPPLKGESKDSILKRVSHVMSYTPSICNITDNNSFTVGYSRSKTTRNLFEVIKQMKWDVEITKNDLIICRYRGVLEEKTTPLVPSEIKVPVVTIVGKHEKFFSIKDLYSDDEKLAKFNAIYDNEELWVKIPSGDQTKILKFIINDMRTKPQVYAEYLLNISKENRPIFSNDEIILELKLMIFSDGFVDKHSVEIQDSLISLLKNSLTDEMIIKELLD